MPHLRICLACTAIPFCMIGLPAHASGVAFQQPEFQGDGCPHGSAKTVIAADGQSLGIQFSGYSPAGSSQHCNLSIPVHIPEGFQVYQLTTDYHVQVEGNASLTRSYTFAGQAGPKISDNFTTPAGNQYTQRDNLIAMSQVVGQCGQNILIRISSQLRTKQANSHIRMGSPETPDGIRIYLQARPC